MLLGWHLDVIVGYLIRSLFHWIRFRGSAGWSIEKATVADARVEDVYGGPVAEIGYTYEHKGEYFAGTHSKAFLLRRSADDYAARFWKGSKVTIRLRPNQQATSVVLDEDQTTTKLNLAAS